MSWSRLSDRFHKSWPTGLGTLPQLAKDRLAVTDILDANHRNRIAFVRIASGKYTPGMKLKVMRNGKELRPTSG